ncbi:hypothetical protein ACFWF9_21745, partial [Streptomyces roseolus]|uniref:hypothetical protein n=1 Tax=Streptomyces roseolus TaxID=67358 RepID=UPI00364BD00D
RLRVRAADGRARHHAARDPGVGPLRLFGDRLPAARTALPVVAAVLVTAATPRWAAPLLHEDPAVLSVRRSSPSCLVRR